MLYEQTSRGLGGIHGSFRGEDAKEAACMKQSAAGVISAGRDPEIRRAFHGAMASLSELEGLTDHLVTSLQPVLGPETPSNQPTQPTQEKQLAFNTEIGSGINSIENRIERIIFITRSAIQRLEI